MAATQLLTNVIDEVYNITKRKDLVSQTLTAVKAATLKLHQTDFYFKDLFETGIELAEEKFEPQIDIVTLFPRYRAMKYIRKVSKDTFYSPGQSGYTPGMFLTARTPTDVLDDYGYGVLDIYYQAGDTIKIKSSTIDKHYLLGMYLNPNIIPEQYNSWIAREYIFAIVYDAAATVFKGIGFDEQASQIRQDTMFWAQEVKNSNIVVQGR